MLLSPARYEELNKEVVDLLDTYGLTSYPLDVFALAGKMGIVLRSYSSIPLSKRKEFEDVSKDAFTIAKGEYEVDTTFICFNQNAARGRRNHSIAHEISHIWLEHPSSDEPYETEAEYFAAYLLAPIPLLIDNKISTISEVQRYFDTSYDAARISLERASNRCRCGKPRYDYEYSIIDLCDLKEGGAYESA